MQVGAIIVTRSLIIVIRRSSNNNTTSSKFKGKCDDLKGHIYDCSSTRQADQFMTTTKEIAEYIGRTYKYGGDIKKTIQNLEEVDIEEPELEDDATEVRRIIFTREADEYVKRKTFLRENMKTAYTLILGQCTELLRAKLEASSKYEDIDDEQNPIDLLREIKSICFKFEDHRYFFIQCMKLIEVSTCLGNNLVQLTVSIWSNLRMW